MSKKVSKKKTTNIEAADPKVIRMIKALLVRKIDPKIIASEHKVPIKLVNAIIKEGYSDFHGAMSLENAEDGFTLAIPDEASIPKYTAKAIKITDEEREVVLTLCDAHIPFEDPKAMQIAFGFAKHLQPKVIVIGEWLDAYQLSKFDKDPKRLFTLQSDLDKCVMYLRELRRICPKSRIISVKCNHHDRLEKFLRTRAPELHGLRSLKLAALLHYSELGIEEMDTFTYNNIVWLHGSVIRKYSGFTAKAEFDKNGQSVCSQHTHRGACYYERKRGGFFMAMESGCLCDLSPEYMEGSVANWIQGVSVVAFEKNSGRYYGTFIPILDNKLMWGGRSFSSTI